MENHQSYASQKRLFSEDEMHEVYAYYPVGIYSDELTVGEIRDLALVVNAWPALDIPEINALARTAHARGNDYREYALFVRPMAGEYAPWQLVSISSDAEYMTPLTPGGELLERGKRARLAAELGVANRMADAFGLAAAAGTFFLLLIVAETWYMLIPGMLAGLMTRALTRRRLRGNCHKRLGMPVTA